MSLYETFNSPIEGVKSLIEVPDELSIHTDLDIKVHVNEMHTDDTSVDYRIKYEDVHFSIISTKESDSSINWSSHRGEFFDTSHEAIIKSIEEKGI